MHGWHRSLKQALPKLERGDALVPVEGLWAVLATAVGRSQISASCTTLSTCDYMRRRLPACDALFQHVAMCQILSVPINISGLLVALHFDFSAALRIQPAWQHFIAFTMRKSWRLHDYLLLQRGGI